MNKTILIALLVTCSFLKAAAQKGETSLAAGLLVAIPNSDPYKVYETWNTGFGAEAIGQYNFTRKSSLLLQIQVIHFPGQETYGVTPQSTEFTSTSLKGGYRLDISPYGFYANALIGFELDGMYTPATLGIGKRFHVGKNFIDLGVEATGGYVPHTTIRVVYSLFRKTKENR